MWTQWVGVVAFVRPSTHVDLLSSPIGSSPMIIAPPYRSASLLVDGRCATMCEFVAHLSVRRLSSRGPLYVSSLFFVPPPVAAVHCRCALPLYIAAVHCRCALPLCTAAVHCRCALPLCIAGVAEHGV
eukprot:GHVU01160319.1.p3 GENE.GHVU01160319.1~~GHVU01160319.1.p3  ORF type:complete len:128 (+),score=0.85 GHVU01160319.1:726-1109(+)